MKILEFNFGRELQENIHFLLEMIIFPHTSSQALKKITVGLSLENTEFFLEYVTAFFLKTKEGISSTQGGLAMKDLPLDAGHIRIRKDTKKSFGSLNII